MGARGKRRKRADGSIAGKKHTATSYGLYRHDTQLVYRSLEAVSVDALAAAIDITYRYEPLDGTRPEEGYDWDIESQLNETDALAERMSLDAESLNIRAEKLAKFLQTANGQQFYSTEGEKVTVNGALLVHASNCATTDDPRDRIEWPLPSS